MQEGHSEKIVETSQMTVVRVFTSIVRFIEFLKEFFVRHGRNGLVTLQFHLLLLTTVLRDSADYLMIHEGHVPKRYFMPRELAEPNYFGQSHGSRIGQYMQSADHYFLIRSLLDLEYIHVVINKCQITGYD